MSRRQEIVNLIENGNYNEALINELKQIDAAAAQAKAERQNQIQSAIKNLVVSGVTFTELMEAKVDNQPVFKQSDLISYAQKAGIKVTKGAAKSAGEGGATRNKQDHGILLFVLPKVTTKGGPKKIGSKDTKIVTFTESHKAFVKQGGDLKANLLATAVDTPEAKQFLASPQGQSFVDNYVAQLKAKSQA